MRILVVGAGGVGSSVVPIAAKRDFFEAMVVADYDATRAERTVARQGGDPRFIAARVDASSAEDVAGLIREHRITHVLNAVDPRFVMPIFEGALAAGADYLDMAMSLSKPHPERPYAESGIKLGDAQFERATAWSDAGRLALVGIGVEPGLSDVFARYAADHLFSEIDEVGIRDGANLVVDGYDFAPSFSIWTTIEECLNPPVIYERDRGWFTTPPFSEPETFDFPEGIGPVECVNVEHEEVLLVPRWVDARRVTFKYGLGDEFIEVLRVLHKLGLDRTDKLRVGGAEVSPRDVVAAALPDPATLGDRMHGKTCAGTWVSGTRGGRTAAAGLPLPRGRQRMDDARVRLAGGRLADGDQPGRGPRAAGGRDVERHGRARTRGVRRRTVPRPAHGLRLAVGTARGRLTRSRPAGGGALGRHGSRRRLPALGREAEPLELERRRDDAADQRPCAERARRLPGTRGDDDLRDLAAGHVAAEPMDGHPIALRPDRQLQRVAGRPLPDLGRVHDVPMRPLARGEQVQDRAAARPPAAGRLRRSPRLDVPAALGVRAHAEGVDHLGGRRHRRGHVRSDRYAARANPTHVARPTGRPPIS